MRKMVGAERKKVGGVGMRRALDLMSQWRNRWLGFE